MLTSQDQQSSSFVETVWVYLSGKSAAELAETNPEHGFVAVSHPISHLPTRAQYPPEINQKLHLSLSFLQVTVRGSEFTQGKRFQLAYPNSQCHSDVLLLFKLMYPAEDATYQGSGQKTCTDKHNILVSGNSVSKLFITLPKYAQNIWLCLALHITPHHKRIFSLLSPNPNLPIDFLNLGK